MKMEKIQQPFMQIHKRKMTQKTALLALALIVFAPAMQGQNNRISSDSPLLTHTVGYSAGDQDSWEHIGMVPFWAGFMGAKGSDGSIRQHHHSQTIYTEDNLQPLTGSRISKISYRIYAKTAVASYDWNARGEIKLAATDATNLRYDFVDMASLSPVSVCYGEFKYSNYIMEFEFEKPFTYLGGNLIVDMMKYAGTGHDYTVSFMGGSSCFADDPWNQEWKKNPDNWVSRLHLNINKKENYNEAWHRFPEITFYYTPINFFMITASTTPGGVINQSGDICVEEFNNQTFNFTPNTGYKTAQVLIDGVNNPEAVETGSYTFEHLDAHHKIEVFFEASVKVYSHLNNIYIQNETNLPLEKAEISDVTGNVVCQAMITGPETIIPFQKANGVYNVKLISQNRVISNTKVSMGQ